MASYSIRRSKRGAASPCVGAARPRARSRRSEGTNTALYLGARAHGAYSADAGTLLRNNLRLLRQIVLQDTTEFKKVWTRHSKSPIAYDSGRIYFENYRCCFSSVPSTPQRLYEFPKQPKAEKIEDALLCQCPLDRTLPKASDHHCSLLVLTANNCLYRLSAQTGQELQKVFLSAPYKFRYLGWDVPQNTFYIRSVQKKQTPLGRQAGLDNDTIIHLAVFRVFPLEVVAVLEISKTVFGHSVVDVILSQGLLVVSYSTKVVKLFSFENIVNKYKTQELVLGQSSEFRGVMGTVGEVPFGVPVNLHIHELPQVLFELPCLDNSVQIGGFPWHFIYTPNQERHRGTYHICSLKDSSLAYNGIQDMQCNSLESDWIFFHPDDSGRIIHVGPSKINVLKILDRQDSQSLSEVVQEFSITAQRDSAAVSEVSVTSSGRTVKRRVHQLDDDPEKETFKIVEYEDELDLLVVVEVTLRDDRGRANVGFYGNHSGVFLKRNHLVEAWDVTYSHEFFFDRDTLVHIAQEKNNFCCHVYKMTCGRAKERLSTDY